MNATTIVLADDHRIVRQGLRAVLENEDGFQIVGEANDGPEAVQQVERLQPDVLILDWVMPQLSGLVVLQEIRKRSLTTRVIILSMHREEAYVVQALQQGASAYVLKDVSASDLVRAVTAVMAGQLYLSLPFSEQGIEAYIQKAKAAVLDAYEELTEREREVMVLAAEGYSSAEIGAQLFISPRTVETHRANLMHKLGLHSQTELIRYALRRGIISLNN